MVDFSKWAKYVVEKNQRTDDAKHVFYKLDNMDIENAKKKLGYGFPKELEEFYKQVGYGFLCADDKDAIDRMMDPESIADFLTYNNQEEDKYFIEYCKMENVIPFFEIGDGAYITINRDDNRIFYFDNVIATSLQEFLEKMHNHTDYYLEFEIEE